MVRTLLILSVAMGFAACTFADPVKKPTTVDSDKLTKECGTAFAKAIIEGKADDALKLCATPFLDPNGMVLDTLDNLKKEFSHAPPPGFELKVVEAIALDKFNEWSKKKGSKELTAEQLKQYGEFLGKDGRIVTLEVKVNGQVRQMDDTPHMLIRVKDGKAQIVGVGGR
ncbi:MAG: hypothetical protein U0798_13135 [Gemmataceae bacterium]